MKYLRFAILFTIFALVLIMAGGALAGWSTYIIDDGGEDRVGQFTSQEIVSGQPAISYVDDTNDDLKYVRAVDAEGQIWGTPDVIDTSNVRSESDLFIVDGAPAIAYFDSTQKYLKFVRAKDNVGTSWNTPVIVDDSGIADWYLGAAVVDGNPAICYSDVNNYNLMYVRSTDAQGTAWDTPQVVDNSTDTGYECSIAIVDGNPAISYYEYIAKDEDYVKFVRATDSTGAAWGTPQIVDDSGGSIYFSELRIVNGNPALAYHDGINDRLKFVRANNNQGSTWGTPVILDSGDRDVGLFTSLAVVNNYPAVSYVANKAGDPELRYVGASDISGTTWNEPELVGVDHTGWWNSLADFNGQAGISSYDSPNEALRYALHDPSVDYTIHLPLIINN